MEADFTAALVRLSPTEFSDFVADLWEARGRSVQRDGRRLSVSDPTGSAEQVLYPLVADEEGPVPAGVDVLVSADQRGGRSAERVVGPTELYQLTRFGIDRPASDRLLAEHVDESLTWTTGRLAFDAGQTGTADGDSEVADEEPGVAGEESGVADDGSAEMGADGTAGEGEVSTAEADERTSTADAGGDSLADRRTLLVTFGGFLGGFGIAAAGVPGSVDTAGETSGPPGGTATRTPARILAPGLDADGVADPNALASAHGGRLESTSFTIASRKTVHGPGGELFSSLGVTVRVAESRAFRAWVATAGPGGWALFEETPARVELWSDGDTYLRRVGVGADASVSGYQSMNWTDAWRYWANVIPFGGEPYDVVEFYRDLFTAIPVDVSPRRSRSHTLSATDVHLDSAPLVFDLLLHDSPVRELGLVAAVTRRGFVDSIRLGYGGRSKPTQTDVGWSFDYHTLEEVDVHVHWTIEYRALGETAVDRPAWVAEA